MLKNILRRFLSLTISAVMIVALLPVITVPALAADTALSGLSDENIGLTTDKSDAWSATGTTITGSVKGTSSTCSSSRGESTLKITNNKTVPAILSFSYKITQNDNDGTIMVAGTSVTADGTYSRELAAGAFIEIYLKSASGTYTTAVELSGISLTANVQATTTFQPAENGSYTVDGVEITAETPKTQQATEAYTLAATPASGYKFVSWYSVTEKKYLSSDTPATMSFDIDQTITAVFTEEANPVFDVSGTKFTDLNEANTYAVKNSLTKIVLVSDGTLNSGSYTISSGVTLLIPFDNAYTCYTTEPANTGTVWTNPSVYKKLTIAEGASITVDGAISVSAKHYAYAQSGGGAPDGKYGYIYMNEGSSITVNDGGGLYVYGFVSGKGTVTAKSGATVYENMQICDFRGGSATSGMNNNRQKIFPLNQYFIQNIEAELILESGADEYIYTSIYAANKATSTTVHFIGNSGAMFSINKGGRLTKKYLPDKDRLEMSINGDGKINNLTLTVMGITVSSSNYVLPINNCMTIKVLSGTTQITQDMALLAGAQVEIASGATVQINEGASLYVYDADQWTAANYASNAKFKTVLYSPTRTYTRKASDLIDARIDVNGTLKSNGYIYTTAGGADIVSTEGTGQVVMENGAGTESATYMYKDYTTDYDEIPITPAQLHNANNTYFETKNASAGDTITYCTCPRCGGKWDKIPYFAAICNSDGTQTGIYPTLQDAVNNYTPDSNTYIQLLHDTTENIDSPKNLCLDLNGCTVTGNFNMTGHTLYGMDSATDEYNGVKKAGKIVGSVAPYAKTTYQTPPVPENVDDGAYKRYVAISGKEADGKANLSFHRFNISVTGYRFELAAPECALFFIGKFQGDAEAKKHLTSLGFTLKDGKGTQLGTDSYSLPANPEDIPKESNPGKSPVVLSGDAYLFEVHLKRSFEKNSDVTASEEFSAIAKATFKSSGVQDQDEDNSLSSVERNLSFKKAWEDALKPTNSGMKPKDKEILTNFLKKFGINIKVE